LIPGLGTQYLLTSHDEANRSSNKLYHITAMHGTSIIDSNTI